MLNTNEMTETNKRKKGETKNTEKYIKPAPLHYGKKLYISEIIAERFIQMTAISTILIIIAIFYFVFNESIYAFIERDETTIETVKGSNGNLEQESYSPETYSNEEDEFSQGSYGGIVKDINTDDDIEESESLEYMEDKPITASELIMPNGMIEGKSAFLWQPVSRKPKFNLLPLFVGSLKVTAIGLAIATPLAILAAIFTITFASKRQKEIIKPFIEIIAGFPSVVIGFFALMTLATLFRDWFGTEYRLNAFVAGAGIAIAVIPIIYTVAEDAMNFVPHNLKEASLSLGATRWQTVWRVILPAATPGVFAAIILGFGRAFGETMIVLMASGNAALLSCDLFEPIRTLSATIGAEMAEVEFRGVHYGVLFLIGAILFVFTFTLNALAEFYVKKRLVRKMQGK